MARELRKTGIDIVGAAPWGMHLCQFYQTGADLIEILVPYLKAGLENNEMCVWVTAEPLAARDAESALREQVKDLGSYIAQGRIEIIEYTEWYTKSGHFESDLIQQMWMEKEAQAISKGCAGLRIGGNMSWLEAKDWRKFADYEATLHSVIDRHRIMAICSYLLEKCTPSEIIEAVGSHDFALVKREGKWAIIESAERKKTAEALKESKEYLTEAQKIANLGSFAWDITTGKLDWSDQMYRIFGFESGEIAPAYNTFLGFIHPDDAASVHKAMEQAISEKRRFEAEFRFIRKDGVERVMHSRGEVRYDGQGRPVRMVGTAQDITERKAAEEALRLHELRLQALLDINKMAGSPQQDILDFVREEIIKITRSRFTFIGFLSEDESLMTVNNWSKDTIPQCAVKEKPIHFPVDQAGLWGEAVRERKPIIVNDYDAPDPRKKGCPNGHVPIKRFLAVPVFVGDHIVAVAAVANKQKDYDEGDVRALTSMMNETWRLIRHKQAEEALMESEQKHRSLVEKIAEGLTVTDSDYVFTYVNDRFCEMLGYSKGEILGRLLIDFIDNDCKEFMREQTARRKGGETGSYEVAWAAKDGRTIYTLVSPAGFFDATGKFTGSLGVVTDISDLKEIEARQQLTGEILDCLNRKNNLEELVRTILALIRKATGFAAVGIRLKEGDDFPYFEVNGFSDEFVQAENSLCARDDNGELIRDPQNRPFLECMCGAVLSGRTDSDLPFFTEGGSFWTNSTTMLIKTALPDDLVGATRNRCNQAGYESVALIPLRSGDRIVGLLQLNDTWPGRVGPELIRFLESIGASIGIALSRIRAEHALARSEERYSLAQLAANIGSWDWNILTGALIWSDRIEPMFGFAPGQFGATYEAFLECVHPEDRQNVIESVNACVERGRDYAIEHRIVWPDGTVRWVSETGNVIRDDNGRAVRMLGIVQDITDRKYAEEQIESLAKFPSEDPYPVLRLARDGTVLYANTAAGELLAEWGCEVGTKLPKHWHQYICQVLDTSSSSEMEVACGNAVISLIIAPVVDAGYVNVYGIDITGRKQAEEDLRRYREHLEKLVQARTAELTEANEQLREEIRLRKNLEREILQISEREQRRIGQELHDSIGQQFTGIAFMAKVLEQRLAEQLPELAGSAAEIARLVNGATDQARALAKGLHPLGLDAETVVSALQELASGTEHLFGIKCTFHCERSVAIKDTTVASNLYRIAQEAVNNAVKHGKAKNIRITLARGDQTSVLTVENDGRDFSAPKKTTGMGLHIMSHRVEMIGGTLEIRKAPHGGTLVTCTFPNIVADINQEENYAAETTTKSRRKKGKNSHR